MSQKGVEDKKKSNPQSFADGRQPRTPCAFRLALVVVASARAAAAAAVAAAALPTRAMAGKDASRLRFDPLTGRRS